VLTFHSDPRRPGQVHAVGSGLCRFIYRGAVQGLNNRIRQIEWAKGSWTKNHPDIVQTSQSCAARPNFESQVAVMKPDDLGLSSIITFYDQKRRFNGRAQRTTRSPRRRHKAFPYHPPAKLSDCSTYTTFPAKTCFKTECMIRIKRAHPPLRKAGHTPDFHVLPPGDDTSILGI
jgi:hypothetical protein